MRIPVREQRETRRVTVRDVAIGGDARISVQTMVKQPTTHVAGVLEEIQRTEGISGTEPLAKEDAQGWRETLQTLVAAGRAAHEWDRFTAAHTPLRERYRQVYQALHRQRDDAVAQARQRLESAGVPTQALFAYECQGLIPL